MYSTSIAVIYHAMSLTVNTDVHKKCGLNSTKIISERHVSLRSVLYVYCLIMSLYCSRVPMKTLKGQYSTLHVYNSGPPVHVIWVE